MLFSVNTHFLPPSRCCSAWASAHFCPLWWMWHTVDTYAGDTLRCTLMHTTSMPPFPMSSCLSRIWCFSEQVSFFMNIPHKPDLQYPWAIWHITEKMDRSRGERKRMECNPGRSHFLFRTPGVSVSSISDVIFPLPLRYQNDFFSPLGFDSSLGNIYIEECIT